MIRGITEYLVPRVGRGVDPSGLELPPPLTLSIAGQVALLDQLIYYYRNKAAELSVV